MSEVSTLGCTECNFRGITQEGKKCLCVIRKELMFFLPEYLHKVKTLGENSKDFLGKVDGNLFIINPYGLFQTILKTYLIDLFLKKDGKVSYAILTGRDVMDSYCNADDCIIISKIIELDFLVFKLGNDPVNKALPEVMMSICKSRLKPMWVYVESKEIFSSQRFTELYGFEFKQHLKSSGEFKKMGNAGAV